jgi:ubiquinone/menaquinone biosynthesis C-methylase UbiE
MLEWTGERFLPWIEDATIAYEHLHRYAVASQFVEGRRVLDLATGEGYGASLLARQAASVIGIDLDEATIHHASNKYDQANLHFLVGDITQIPILAPQSCDVIICFEAIEHVEAHQGLLDEIKRLLVKDGLFIISTPNKLVYTDEPGFENPFHVKELDFESFSQLLNRNFKRTCFLGQRIYCNSNIWPVPAGSIERENQVTEYLIEKKSEFAPAESDQRNPRYFLGLATDGSADLGPRKSVLVDVSDEFTKQSKRAAEKTHLIHQEALTDLKTQVNASQVTVRSQLEDLASKAAQIRSQENDLSIRADQVSSLEKELATRGDQLHQMGQIIEERNRELSIIKDGMGWKVLTRIQGLKKALLPEDSRRRKLYDRLRKGLTG